MEDFRPISMLQDHLQGFANRLREVLGELIEDHQSGFLKGRNSLDSIAIAQEVIQFSTRNKLSGFTLKLDFEKAYDMVEWECILRCY